MRKIITLLFLISICPAWGQNYIGTDFRIAFLKNINPLFNGDPIFEITVEAIQTADVTVEFGLPGDPFYIIQNQTINAGDVFSFTFDNGETLNQELLDIEETLSFHITSSADVRAYGFHNRVYFSEASSILPKSSLGTEYLVMAFNDGNGLYPSLFNIIATEDDTNVEVIPSAETSFATAGQPFNLNMDEGEVITISSEGDLTGSRITSDNGKPVAVFGGQQQGLIGANCGADSHMFDQIIPLNFWGSAYAIIPVNGSDGELMRVLASEDNTDLYNGCDLLTTLNEGDIYEEFIAEPFLLSGTEPFSVAMFTPSLECSGLNLGDPNMRTLLPVDQANTSIKLETNYWFQDDSQLYNVIHLVMPSDETGNITINNNVVGDWQPFPSNPSLSYTGYVVKAFTDLLSIESTTPFWSELVALAFYDAMTMNFGATTTMEIPPFIIDVVNLGPDQVLCPGESVTLDPQLNTEGVWQDGTISESYSVEGPGVYSVTIDGACGDGFDEVEVLQGFIPNIELDDSYAICQGEELEIGVAAEELVEYEWNTGETTSTITIQFQGNYELTAISEDGCEVSAETELTLTDGPELSISGPSEICEGESAVLNAVGEDGEYTWNDGSSGTSLEVNGPGTYSVTLSLGDGCSSTEFYNLPGLNEPVVFSFDSTFCEGSSITFTLNSPNATISWPGLSDSQFLTVNKAGIYNYEAENECALFSGSISLETFDCSCQTYVPNAFSPNNDGLNDLFKPVINCPVENYELSIYNRWGKEVFVSTDPSKNWNGASDRDGDYFTQAEVYYYILRFDNLLEPLSETQEYSGSLTLIR